jgi:hypothetical protein
MMQTQGVVILCIECQRLDWAGRYCSSVVYCTVIRLLRQKVQQVESVDRCVCSFSGVEASESARSPVILSP